MAENKDDRFLDALKFDKFVPISKKEILRGSRQLDEIYQKLCDPSKNAEMLEKSLLVRTPSAVNK